MSWDNMTINKYAEQGINHLYDDSSDFGTLRFAYPIRASYPIMRRLNPLLPFANTYICGGFARYLCSPHFNVAMPEDVDFFFKRPSAYFLMQDRLIESGYELVFESETALSFEATNNVKFQYILKPGIDGISIPSKLQLVKPIRDEVIITCGENLEILSYIDFTICKICVSGNEAIASEHFLQDEQDRKLRIKHVVCPFNTLYRLAKYTQKGYTFSTYEAYNLFDKWDSLSAQVKDNLKKHIIGENNGI